MCGFEVLSMARYGPKPEPKKWTLWQFSNGKSTPRMCSASGGATTNVFDGGIQEPVALAGSGGRSVIGPNSPTQEVRMFI